MLFGSAAAFAAPPVYRIPFAGLQSESVKLSISPATYAFGSVATGQSVSANFTVSNAGTVPASGLTYKGSADFSVSGSCTDSLAAGSQCVETVTYTPMVASAEQGSLTVANGQTAASASLSGTGFCSPGAQAFTTSSTFAAKAGCSTYLVLAVGGGGGGGEVGTGSGGSGYVNVQYANGLSGTVNVVVGTGGTGGKNDGWTYSTPGTSSCFGTICAAGGGAGYTATKLSGDGANGGSGGGASPASTSNAGGAGGSNGGSGVSGYQAAGGSGQGAFASYLALFTRNVLTAAPGGAGGAFAGGTWSGGGGGGGVYFNGGGGGGGTGGGGAQGGHGGAGYGGGGGAVGGNGLFGASAPAGGSGAAGLVYVEWSK
jgi:hypothetical protein